MESLKENPDFFKTDPDRDWPEDFPHENGNYINKCCDCQLFFMGHKRRPVCRKCANAEPDWEKMAHKKAPEDNKCAHAGCWADGNMTGFAQCMVKRAIPLQKELTIAKEEIERLKQELQAKTDFIRDNMTPIG